MPWWMIILLTTGGGDLLDAIRPGDYWRVQGVEATAANMLARLHAADAAATADLVRQLGSAQHGEREAAQGKLEALGAAARPQLQAAAESPDPEVRERAKALLEKLAGHDQAPAIRRLMAIRTLGELKHAPALPVLRGLLNSKVPFEAEYAAWAVAAIEGKPHTPPAATPEQMERDLWLLPGNCGIVGQLTRPPGPPLDVVRAAKDLGPLMGERNPEKAAEELVAGIIMLAEQIGNFRLDGLTVGVSDNVGEESGFVIVVGRGQCDPAALRAAIMKEGVQGAEKIGAVEALRLDRECSAILASDERLVLVAGPTNRDGRGDAEAAIREFAAALAAGKGRLAENAAMAGLVKSADRTGPVWAVVNVCEAYRQAPMVDAFKTLTLATKATADRTDFTLRGEGTDAEKVAAAVEQFNQLMAEGHKEIAGGAEEVPFLKPMADFVGSLKATSDGAAAVATGQLKGAPSSMLAAFVWFLMGMSASEVHPLDPDMIAPPVDMPGRVLERPAEPVP